ncbi:MAG: Asp-tRNA(Asn)/Glu-tRNA(Gln) amidotransferase subunit GatB [Candidatus Pacearchaeota archaeon]
MELIREHPLKIGLEIHCYLNTKEKLFCKCSTSESNKPNSNICPICTGTPGSKPMLVNKEAIKKLIQVGLILNCKIEEKKDLIFQRKHYNWPDLPKGFQNTISGAHCSFPAYEGNFKDINIWECHLEEDPAQWNPENGYINYNRSGLPLVEVVTAPDFREVEKVISWLKNFILSLSYIKAIKKNAGIKVDVNISTYGERVEIKNLNSLEKIQKAINYEISRQLEANQNNEKIIQETRRYDELKEKTFRMRTKENAQDYRFIPDPDLPIIKLNSDFVQQIKKELPESPDEKLKKLLLVYDVKKSDAEVIMRNLELVEFFEELAKEGIDVKKNLSWITIELLRILNYNKKSLDDSDIDIRPSHLAELINLVERKELTILKAKQIMNDFIPKSFSIKEKKDILKITGEAVQDICQKVIKQNPKAVQDYKDGQESSLNFLIGQVMKQSQRRADFSIAKKELEKILKK